MRMKFDEQLELLNRKLIIMGGLAEKAIGISAHALEKGQTDSVFEEVSAVQEDIDRDEREIESMCIKLIMQQQPVARDLRVISAALKMVTDLERIGDQALDIAEVMKLGNTGAADSNDEDRNIILEMTQAVRSMVTDSIDAFVSKDVEKAQAVIAYDDVVDNSFDKAKDMLIRQLKAESIDGEKAIDLLMICKYLEKIGDHAENLSGWVVFSITGEFGALSI